MKKHNILAILGLGLIFTACNDDKKNENNSLTIDSSKLKQIYNTNESITLEINNPNNTAIDSVVYFSNDVRIGSNNGKQPYNFALSNEKYGSKLIKANIYSQGNKTEATVLVNLFSKTQPEVLNYEIVNTFPHDIKAYTQGLEFYGDVLVESTGNGEGVGTRKKGKSSVRKVNPQTGEVLKINELPDSIFGEGATILNNKLYQLTYQNNEAYVYNLETLEKEQTIPYFKKMEGWGLTNDGTNLYMTDGSDKIYIIDPTTFKLIDYFIVSTNNGTIPSINELEWVNGKIFANFYGQEAIAVINPKDGSVENVVDLSALRSKVTKHADLDVLNGIAYNKKTDTYFVTGKNWDKMFEIKINK